MKKFTENDLFYNTLLANPKYKVIFQSGSLRINDQINQNGYLSSSISAMEISGTYYYSTYTGSYQFTASINRDFIYKQTISTSNTFNASYTDYSSVIKVATIKNTFKDYKLENEYANIDYYLENDGVPYNAIPAGSKKPDSSYFLSATNRVAYYIRPTSSINLIQIPAAFYGNYIKPGSLQLNMYVSGVLTASASDTDKTGKIYQTYGSGSGNIIGTILYDHGFILLTGAYALNNELSPYIQPLPKYSGTTSPVNDYLKWIYFGSYSASVDPATETKYELIFQGANFIPTLTMMCNVEKNELYWSNNRTFIESGQGDDLFFGQSTSSVGINGSTYYSDPGSFLIPSSKMVKENNLVTIKNTISSSFANYSASYEPQVFISEIGIYDEEKNLIDIAKLANPVRKTKDLDYTFKLKLDF
jgi:hypothetical protein